LLIRVADINDCLKNLQAEGSESYVWVGSSQPITECPGCSKLRREVDDLKTKWMSLRQRDDDDVNYCRSTYISDRKQTEIDLLLLETRQKADRFQEAYEKVKVATSELQYYAIRFFDPLRMTEVFVNVKLIKTRKTINRWHISSTGPLTPPP